VLVERLRDADAAVSTTDDGHGRPGTGHAMDGIRSLVKLNY
jgi:hypothetical protein